LKDINAILRRFLSKVKGKTPARRTALTNETIEEFDNAVQPVHAAFGIA
jgi:hypothetical protein